MNRVMNQQLAAPAAARTTPTAAAGARSTAGRLFRKCSCGGDHAGECEECKKAKLRRSSVEPKSSTASVPGVVNEVLRKAGAPIDAAERTWMESRFGHDFSRVRIHDDARAAESADAVNARAYTVGSHVVFGAGEYQRGSTESRKLLAHELAHVVQQSGAQRDPREAARHSSMQMAAATAIGGEHDPEELEAEAVAARVTQGLAARTRNGNPSSAAHPIAAPSLTQQPGVLQRVARATPPTLTTAVTPVAPVTAPARALFAAGLGPRGLALPADAGSDSDPSSRFQHASGPGVLRRQACGNQAPLTQSPHGPCDANARGLEPCCTQSMLNEIRALRERACPLVAQAVASLAQPEQVADKLRAYFGIEPSDAASVAAVRAGLSAMLDFLQRGDVQFFCWDACDSMCSGIRAKASPDANLSQHLIALCGDYTGAVQQGRPYLAQAEREGELYCGMDLRDRITPHNWVRTLIHEYAHVSSRLSPVRGGMLAACTPGTPGCTPEFSAISPESPRESALLLRNPDSYAHFVWAVQQGAAWRSNVPGQAGGSSGSSLAIGLGIGIGLAVAAGAIALGVYFANKEE